MTIKQDTGFLLEQQIRPRTRPLPTTDLKPGGGRGVGEGHFQVNWSSKSTMRFQIYEPDKRGKRTASLFNLWHSLPQVLHQNHKGDLPGITQIGRQGTGRPRIKAGDHCVLPPSVMEPWTDGDPASICILLGRGSSLLCKAIHSILGPARVLPGCWFPGSGQSVGLTGCIPATCACPVRWLLH